MKTIIVYLVMSFTLIYKTMSQQPDFMEAKAVMESLQNHKQAIKAVEESRSLLPKFLLLAKEHNNWLQHRFVAVAMVQAEGIAVPIGCVVESSNETHITGYRFENTRKDMTESDTLTIPLSAIVDVSYVELGELQGGYLYKHLFAKLGSMQQRFIYGPQARSLILGNDKLSMEQRQELAWIAGRDPRAIDLFLSVPKKLNFKYPISMVPLSDLGQASIFDMPLHEFVARYGGPELGLALVRAGYITPVGFPEMLCNACLTGNIEIATAFLDSGYDVNYTGDVGRALDVAVMWDHYELSDILLKRGASLDPDTYDRSPPLFSAKNARMAKLLIKYGADINFVSDRYSCVAHHVDNGRWDVVKELVAAGAEVSPNFKIPEYPKSIEQKGQEAIARDALTWPKAEREQHLRLQAIDYGTLLPVRALNIKTGKWIR
jgi:hypothetical protein